MKRLVRRYTHIRQEQQGIEAVSLMISLIVAVMVIAVIYVLIPRPVPLDKVNVAVVAQSGAEYTSGIIYQTTEAAGTVQLTVTVLDKESNGVPKAAVEVTAPGYPKMTNATNDYGNSVFIVQFKLPSRAGSFITIKASGGGFRPERRGVDQDPRQHEVVALRDPPTEASRAHQHWGRYREHRAPVHPRD